MADTTNQVGSLANSPARRAFKVSRRNPARDRALASCISCWSAVLDALLEPILVSDKKGRVVWGNHAARKLHGDNSTAPSGWEMACRGSESLPEGLPQRLWRSSHETTTDILLGSRWYQVTATPLLNSSGKLTGTVHLMSDSTQRKAAESALRERIKALEQRVAERSADLQRLQRSLRKGEANLRCFVNNAPLAVAMFDRQMRYLAVSRRWLADYHLEKQDVLGVSCYQLSPDLPEHWRTAHQRGLAGEVLGAEENLFECSEGSTRWIRWAINPWYEEREQVGGIIVLTEELTSRKRSEQLLQQVNRTLQAIRACHEAMLRATAEPILLNGICQTIVRIAGQRMAWVGYAQADRQKTVLTEAAAGVHGIYPQHARITWANQARGRGPVGTAIRTQKPALCNDTLTDPNFAPWRKEAVLYGYRSVLALPLVTEARCFGALAIYASVPRAFDSEQQVLLREFSNELAFAIVSLRLRAERQRLERELLRSTQQEQERIGRDLHDGLCHWLVGAKYQSAYLMSLAKGRFPAMLREARRLEKMLCTALEQTRELASGLNPAKLTLARFEAALKKLAENLNLATGPQCSCRIDHPIGNLDPRALRQLYRIAQEALQNALKHAAAKHICIRLRQTGRHTTLEVNDDGRGIRSGQVTTGMGLRNMRARAQVIGASIIIRSRKSGGTTVCCKLPRTRSSAS